MSTAGSRSSSTTASPIRSSTTSATLRAYYPYGFFDDGERFAFLSKAITESLQHLPAGFECDSPALQ